MSAALAPLVARIGRIVECTTAEGPGARFAVWVQGCTIRCRGCFNPQFFAARGGHELTVDELLARVPETGIEGVTLLGGEPFEQADALAAFARACRQRGLGVMTFSGFSHDELERRALRESGVADLLENTDLLVDGPFLEDDIDHVRPWVGSRNQGLRTLTDRYRHLEAQGWLIPDRLEIRVDPSGTTAVNGWASVDALESLLDGLRRS